MSAGLLDPEDALDQHLEHIVHTLVLLLANTHAKDLAPTFEALLERWWEVDKQEQLLWIATLKATAMTVAADNTLDALVDELAYTLNTEFKNTPELFDYYFEKPPHELRRPVLSFQLEIMDKKWVGALKGSPHGSLQALGAKMEPAVQAGRDAEKALGDARRENREFRMLGDRKKFVDDHNAARKSTDGLLSEMPHRRPELGLPRTFARRFFKRVSRPRARIADELTTSAAVALRIAEVSEQLDELKQKHDELSAAEKAATQQQERQQADEDALEAAEREAGEALAKVAALKAKLGK